MDLPAPVTEPIIALAPPLVPAAPIITLLAQAAPAVAQAKPGHTGAHLGAPGRTEAVTPVDDEDEILFLLSALADTL